MKITSFMRQLYPTMKRLVPFLCVQNSPSLFLVILFHEVVQFLHPFDVLELQGVLRLPCVVDVRPVLPLHQVLRLARLFAVVKVGIGVPVCFDGIYRSRASRGCEESGLQLCADYFTAVLSQPSSKHSG